MPSKHGHEVLGFIKDGEFLDHLCAYWGFKWHFSYGNLSSTYFQNVVSLSVAGWIIFSDLVV
jgi:hypothetical protein